MLDSGSDGDLTSPYRRVWLIATACATLAALVMVVSFPRRPRQTT